MSFSLLKGDFKPYSISLGHSDKDQYKMTLMMVSLLLSFFILYVLLYVPVIC